MCMAGRDGHFGRHDLAPGHRVCAPHKPDTESREPAYTDWLGEHAGLNLIASRQVHLLSEALPCLMRAGRRRRGPPVLARTALRGVRDIQWVIGEEF